MNGKINVGNDVHTFVATFAAKKVLEIKRYGVGIAVAEDNDAVVLAADVHSLSQGANGGERTLWRRAESRNSFESPLAKDHR